MSEDNANGPQSAPSMIDPSHPQASGSGVVLPLPAPSAREARTLQRRTLPIAREARTWAILVALLAIVLLPPIFYLLAGVWSTIVLFHTLWLIWQSLRAQQLPTAFANLSVVDVAGRVAAMSASYYALFFSLITLLAGILGHRWRRLYLMPGVLFTILSMLVFGVSAHLSFVVLSAKTGIAAAFQIPLLLYAVVDAFLLAVFLVDARPAPPRARKRRLRRVRQWRTQRHRATPAIGEPVRFGASQPLIAAPPTTPLPPIDDVATADTTSMPALAPHVVSSEHDGASVQEAPPQPSPETPPSPETLDVRAGAATNAEPH